MLDVKFGCQPILWKEGTFENIAREIADIGYDGIEAPVGAFRGKEDELRSIRDETGLEVASTYTGANYMDPTTRSDEIDAAVEIGKMLPQFGCNVMISAPSGLTKDRKAYTLWEHRAFAEAMNEIGRRLADVGVTQVFHNHAWTTHETRLELDLLLANTDPRYLSMGFDTGHLQLGWADPVEMFQLYGDRVKYVHFKDCNGRADIWDAIKNDEDCWTELGNGEVDLAGIVAELDRRDYTGWLTYEQDSSKKPARESATESLAHARKLVAPYAAKK
jgi:inosose dehydratase